MTTIILNLFELNPNNCPRVLFVRYWLLVRWRFTGMRLAVLSALDFEPGHVVV